MLPPSSLFPFLAIHSKQLKPPLRVCADGHRPPPLPPPSAPHRAPPFDLPLLELSLGIGSPPRPKASRPHAIPIPHPSSPEFGPPLAGATDPVGSSPPPLPLFPRPFTGSPQLPDASSSLAPRRRPRGSPDFGRNQALPAGHGSKDWSVKI
jgi:hypothetical protein